MAFRIETLTILPALLLFVLSSYFGFFTSQVVDPSSKQNLFALALSFLVGGLVLTFFWGYYWVISKRLEEGKSVGISGVPSFERLISLSLTALGVITMVWVGQLTWHDITMWNKDIPLIFFGSRTGEYISLGIGMKVIHYFLVGLSLILLGLVVLLRIRKCPHHFGYWATQPKKDSIPKKCIVCPKVKECISGTPQKQKLLVKPIKKKEKDSSDCAHHFGYLRTLPDNQAVPKECMACQKLLECRNVI